MLPGHLVGKSDAEKGNIYLKLTFSKWQHNFDYIGYVGKYAQMCIREHGVMYPV